MTTSTRMNFQMKRTHFSHGMRATPRAAIKTPLVGVIMLVKPSPNCIDYLTGLNERYEKWVKEYDGRLLIIDVDRIKFENRPEDFQEVTDKIDAELFGLF